MKTTIYFLRHGECVSNVKGLYAGHDESPLTDLGRAQALEAAKTPNLPHFDRIVSSDIGRARQTATIVITHLGYSEADIELDPRLQELGLGDLVGTPTRNLIGYLEAERVDGNPHGVEPFTAAQARQLDLLESLKGTGENILLVGHNGSGLIMRQLITHSTEPLQDQAKLENGQIVIFGEITS